MNAHSSAEVDIADRSATPNEPETLITLALITVSNALPLKTCSTTVAAYSAVSGDYYAATPLG